MTPSPFLFHRPTLAKKLADDLEGRDTPFPLSSGVFLAAPRRTGKSTFLTQDLVPELERRDIVTIYVDLWDHRDKEPSRQIADAIAVALRAHESPMIRAARSVGLTRVGLGPVASFDLNLIGRPEGVSLREALGALVARTHRTVALIVDEIQHALSTEEGTNALYALKAARDGINMHTRPGEGPDLLLVCTGSHRDKLGRMVLSRSQAFFGATLRDFPLLDQSYTKAYTAWVNERLAQDNHFDPDDVFQAFQLLACRPELLRDLIADMVLLQGSSGALRTTLATNAAAVRERLWEEYDNAYGVLTPLQRAVLERLAAEGPRFTPYSAASLAVYIAAVGETVEISAVQAAVESLRERDILWRSARGQYALEDQGMLGWLRARSDGLRPPTLPLGN